MGKIERSPKKRMVWRFAVAAAAVVLLAGSVFAWFALNRMTRTEPLPIDMPPVIYIRDDNLEQMVSFDLEGLQINKDYQAVFCVAPAYRGAVQNFDLGVIYTENIGMIVDIYPVTSVAATPGDGLSVERELTDDSGALQNCYFRYAEELTPKIDGEELAFKQTYGGWTNTDENYLKSMLNRGVYKKYTGFKFSERLPDATDLYEKLNDTESYRFFVLTVTWKDEISEAELDKETDIVYIVSKGWAVSSSAAGSN